jgi:cellulose synthase/poly-beta-1,6-N-acetylglucosamine synthase-like glycosyltransferase
MVLALFIFTALLLLAHAILIEKYRYWFLKLKPFVIKKGEPCVTKFSIIIPARNESANIENCLKTIFSNEYPKSLYEIIVVDDYSTDNTADIVSQIKNKNSNLQLIQLEKLIHEKQLNSYKKKAIEIAIQESTGEYIVTTDADCIIPEKWLLSIDSFIRESKAVFVAAPVRFQDNGSFVSKFQCLDFMSLQGITAAAVGAGFHSMCNGANLAYSKKVFLEVGGFKGIDNIASGDDMMLMHKIYKQHNKGIGFIFSNEAVVVTQPMPTWKDFFNQRIRWASKADKFEDKRIIAVLALVYLLNGIRNYGFGGQLCYL